MNEPAAECDREWSILDYPPGPRDDPRLYDRLWAAIEQGICEPTAELRNGQRVWRSLIYAEIDPPEMPLP
jgi:hypothetical protein